MAWINENCTGDYQTAYLEEFGGQIPEDPLQVNDWAQSWVLANCDIEAMGAAFGAGTETSMENDWQDDWDINEEEDWAADDEAGDLSAWIRENCKGDFESDYAEAFGEATLETLDFDEV